jgi:hypothetical protein
MRTRNWGAPLATDKSSGEHFYLLDASNILRWCGPNVLYTHVWRKKQRIKNKMREINKIWEG